MAIKLDEKRGGRLLEVHLSGKLTTEEYGRFVPVVEALMQRHKSIDILIDMSDFHGWELGAIWADTRFAFRHYSDIGRLAVVGEKKWQEWMTTICLPFTKAIIRYFDHSEAQQAREWINDRSDVVPS